MPWRRSSVPTPARPSPEAEARLAAAGRRWLAGEPLDPAALFAGEERRRIPLPTYPFERHRYWIEPSGTAMPVAEAVLERAQTLHPRPGLPTAYVAPRGELEERVAAVWRQVLGVEQVGAHDSFLDLGGDSLLATRLMSRLREELAVDLPMDRLFAEPTVAAVAAAVVEARAGQVSEEDLARMLAEIGEIPEGEAP